ncbi:MAG: sugar transporter, partial [Flavobacteriaceae bacterium]|nr:sugar transporter [Flavobacteriaceae bacterium]
MKPLKKVDIDIDEIRSFDVKEYVLKIISHWKLFVAMVVLGLIVAFFINSYKQRIYSLNSVINVTDEQNPLFTSSTNIAFNWGLPSEKVETIITILKSRTHNEKVVKELEYYIDYLQDGKFRMEDVYGKVPFKVELDTTAYQLLGVPIKLDFKEDDHVEVSVEFEEEEYTLINYETNQTKKEIVSDKNYSAEFTVFENLKTPFSSFKLRFNNLSNIPQGKTYYILFKGFDGTVKSFQNINVKSLTKGASMIELELKGPNKKKIEDYLNTTVEVLDQDQKNQKIQYAIKTKEYIDDVFKDAADNLQGIEQDLGNYKRTNNIYDISVEGQTLFTEVNELDKQRQQIQDRLNYFSNLQNYLTTHSDIND